MFKPIKGFSRYVIDPICKTKNVVTGNVVNWHTSNGYIFATLVGDDGVRRSVGQHRALALAFIEQPETESKLTTNHLDGDITNNVIENLEWTTYSENQTHAYKLGLRRDLIPVNVTCLTTGVTHEFYSKGDAARTMGWYRSVLSHAVKDEFEYRGYKVTMFPEDYVSKTLILPSGVAARSITTNQVFVSDTCGELGRMVGICPKVLRRIIINDDYTYPINGYDIRPLHIKKKWPEYTDEEREVLSSIVFIHTPILVRKGKWRKLYASIEQASIDLDIGQRTIRGLINVCKRSKGGYKFFKYTLKHSRSPSSQ